MRILFVSPRQCWPPRSGAKLREYHFARSLAAGNPLTYLYFTDPGAAPLTTAELPFCEQIVAIPKPPPYGVANLIKGALGSTPLPVLNYRSAEMAEAVHRLTHTPNAYDLIHFEGVHLVSYVSSVAEPLRRRIVYDWHNIESEALLRYSETVSSAARGWYARQTAHKLARLEDQILEDALGGVVCSDREVRQLHQSHPKARLAVVENGVDVAYFAAAKDVALPAMQPAEGPHFLFVGSMDYFPNTDAVLDFVQRTWPGIRQEMPHAKLWVVGANPPPSVTALGGSHGITVTGTVPDVRPYYGHATVSIVPLRTGGGTRLKILEAMAAGTPVVSSPLGAEGLAVTADQDIVLVDPDDAGGWSRQLKALANSPERRSQLAGAALQLVRDRYDWDSLGRTLRAAYQEWLSRA